MTGTGIVTIINNAESIQIHSLVNNTPAVTAQQPTLTEYRFY